MLSNWNQINMKIPNIIEVAMAWRRAANPTDEQQGVAEYRLSICDPCEFKKFKWLKRLFICGSCGCPISKKIYTPRENACPEDKWDL